MSERDGTDAPAPTDTEILAALSVVLDQDEVVPPDAVEAAVAAFTWHSIDADLLEVLYDSAIEPLVPTRGVPEVAPRLMTFRSPAVVVEVELTGERGWVVRGAITPSGRHAIELQQGGGDIDDVSCTSNEAGLFELAPHDERPLRLVITIDSSGARLVTPWIDLTPP